MATATHDINELKRRMQGAVGVLKQELGGLRTGRASASLLEPVQVEAYGSHMPLNQLATISVPEPRLLSVQVWDKSMVHAVEKAISEAKKTLIHDHVDHCLDAAANGGTGKATKNVLAEFKAISRYL